jgi:hypothetical protein
MQCTLLYLHFELRIFDSIHTSELYRPYIWHFYILHIHIYDSWRPSAKVSNFYSSSNKYVQNSIRYNVQKQCGELCAYKKQWIMYVPKLWIAYFLFLKFKVQMTRILWRWHSSHSDSHDNDSRGDSLSRSSKVYSRNDRPCSMPHRCQRRDWKIRFLHTWSMSQVTRCEFPLCLRLCVAYFPR